MKSAFINGAPDTNRTCDPPLRRGMLYPLSYGGILIDYNPVLFHKKFNAAYYVNVFCKQSGYIKRLN